MRVCSIPGCPTLIPKAGRCPEHERAHEQQRGTRKARGYDNNHDQLRRDHAPQVDAGHATCWRCRLPILPGTPWHLGHDDDDRTIYRGPEHAHCNLSAAGKSAHK